MFAKAWSAYQNWISIRPEGITDKEARLHILGRAGYPVAFLAHLCIAVVFWIFEIWPLFWFNVASVVLWGVALWILEVRNNFSYWIYVLCQFVEIPLHGFLATLILGVETGFFLYVLNTMIITIITPFISRTLRIVLAAFFAITLAASGAYAIYFGPLIPQSTAFNTAFFAFNAITLSFVMGMCMGLYEWAASRAEKGLVESRWRTEIANKSLENVSAQLAKYISPQLYQAILNGEQKVRVESKRKKLTVFFSDIVGFTETTDQLESEELTSLLNEYLTEMSKIAQSYGANFDKFIGDAIVLYFGDPHTLGVAEDAAECVRMAISMQQRMNELRQRWLEMGLERPFEMRVGINTGYCTVGNFGSEDRMDYTIIGGEVNLAARLESQADKGGVLLAHETWSLVKDWVAADEAETVTVKGIAKPVKTYRVKGIVDDLVAKGRLIHHESEAMSLSINTEKLHGRSREGAIEALKSAMAKLEEPKA